MLRFLFDITLDRPDIVRHLPVAREPRKAPVILSPEEVARMLAAAPGVKYKDADFRDGNSDVWGRGSSREFWAVHNLTQIRIY
jgi:hypothetical protein